MPTRAVQRIGLTGGVGSGKSTVASMLVACGAFLVDADAISRSLTASGGAAIAPVSARFGALAISADGAMDREFMRRLAFGDAESRQALEAIVHPLVSLEVARQTSHALQGGSTCIVFDMPLLVESGRWRQQLDQVLVVDCSEAMQISRVTTRSGWTAETVRLVMAGQASRTERRSAADAYIYNEGLSLEALAAVVRRLSQRFGL